MRWKVPVALFPINVTKCNEIPGQCNQISRNVTKCNEIPVSLHFVTFRYSSRRDEKFDAQTSTSTQKIVTLIPDKQDVSGRIHQKMKYFSYGAQECNEIQEM